MCNGRSNKAIGQFLDLSENTVKFHLKRIFKKLGAESRAGAMTAALQQNLVIPEEGGAQTLILPRTTKMIAAPES